jgi:hypothetical protein
MENKRKEEIIKKWEESGLLDGLTEMDKDHPMLKVIESVCVSCGKPVKDFDEESNNCCDECWLSA